MTLRSAWWARGRMALVLVLVVLGAACGRGDDEAPPPPAPAATTEPPPSTTTPAPTTTVRPVTTLPGIPRTVTTMPVSLGPGGASISGTVTGPEGPVESAVVRVERLVGTTTVAADLRTDASGGWRLDSILGGPYRVRAFRPPDLGQANPEVFFLRADEQRNLPITLVRSGQASITARVDPNPPRVEQPAVLVVTVGTARVGADGVFTVAPSPAARLQLTLADGITLETPGPQLTDGAGRAVWHFRCLSPGVFAASLVVGNGVTRFDLPACVL
jgi:hypothetical protein